MSSEPYLLYAAFAVWALPAAALYVLGQIARRAWNAPKGLWPETFLAAVCVLWPAVAALGLALAGIGAGVLLFVLTNSIQFNSQR